MGTEELEKMQASAIEKGVDKLMEVKDSGGWKGILIKYGIWIFVPLVILGFAGFYVYNAFYAKKAYISQGGGENSSTYKDKEVTIKINTAISNEVKEDKDVDTFYRVKDKLKKLYGVN